MTKCARRYYGRLGIDTHQCTGGTFCKGDCLPETAEAKVKRLARNKARRDRDKIMRDMGLVKVRGNLGGTYWE